MTTSGTTESAGDDRRENDADATQRRRIHINAVNSARALAEIQVQQTPTACRTAAAMEEGRRRSILTGSRRSRERRGRNPDELPVYLRPTQRPTTLHTRGSELQTRSNFRFALRACLWVVGGSWRGWRSWREATQARGECNQVHTERPQDPGIEPATLLAVRRRC